MTKYILEIYVRSHYHSVWTSDSIERAETMINKPYYRKYTRRLVKITVDNLYTIKKNRY